MGKGTSTTTATQSAAPQATAAYSNLLTQAQNTAATPYQAYTGELTAPVNSQQQAGVAGINQNANYAQPAVNQALGIAGAAANPLTQSQIQNYQNPYTQDVVNATQAQFNNQNQQQQAQLTGNSIAQGALGGNRVGVAQANLAGQQSLAQAPTIAGLYSNSYNQGLATAAQQYQQNPLAAAGSIANFGIQGQGAALSGAGAQLGAGTLEQQTQQAQDTSNYGQYAQAQAYPFQTDQWLAGLETGVAPGLGGTSTTTAPPPNQTAQYLGAGIAGAGLLLSDRRAKKNIHKIGEMHDGQPLYRYQYHGSNEWHVGPVAQEVEKSHPEAVHGIGGAKYVDLKAATDDSVRKAGGGGVGGTPWSFAQGWVPTFSGVGSAAPHISGPGQASTASPTMDWSKLAGTTASPNGIFAASPTYGGGNMFTDANGGSASNPLPGLDASDYGMARGGGVGFADGGNVADNDDPGVLERISRSMNGGRDHGQRALYNATRNGIYTSETTPADGGHPNALFQDLNTRREQQRYESQQIDDDVRGTRRKGYDTGGSPDGGISQAAWNPDEPYRMPDQPNGVNPVDTWRAGNPIPPLGTPPVQNNDDDVSLPPEITGRSGAPSQGIGQAMAFAPNAGDNPAGAYSAPISQQAPDAQPSGSNKGLGVGFGLISPNAQSGLLAAGLGMLASRSPNFGNAIGEGGIAGLTAYSAAEDKDRKIADEAAKLSLEAKRHAEEMKFKQDTQKETHRHNEATEEKEFASKLVPRVNPATGETDYLSYNPKTQKMQPVKIPGTDQSAATDNKFVSTAAPKEDRRKALPASPEARDESYMEFLSKHRPPGYDDVVRAVANYEIDPNKEASLQKGQRDQLYRDVKQFDPTYDQTHFGEKTGVIASFSRGADRAAVNSLNVSVAHLATLGKLGDALNNGGIPAFNKLANTVGVHTGSTGVTNFEAAKEIVGDEVVKAIVGGVSAQADREAIKHLINSAQTPAQLKGTIATFTELLGGQLEGRRKGYEAGTGLNNFDEKYLSPDTREALKRRVTVTGGKVDPEITRMVYPSGVPQPSPQFAASPGHSSSGFTPPAGALPGKPDKNGKVWYYDPQTKQPYPGQ